jgi:tetratricopeptide (TPR) repeat protein
LLPPSPPLPHDRGSAPTTLIACPSVALFVDRAQAVDADFQVTARNAAAVAGLCQRLEGLPLAIELAAARAGVLTPQEMLARLEDRFELLVSRQRRADPRHRSLRATLDGSYQLLSRELQRFFASLSVFRGGWTVAAAEAVCEAPRALEYLEQLRECSLVQATETAGEIRFHLLETLREYGAEQLAAEDRSGVARRHAEFFLALAETAEPGLTGADQELWLERLEREHDNLRTALAWSIESGEYQFGLRLGGALEEFWHARAYSREGRDQLLRLLGQSGAEACTAARARALRVAGRFVGRLDVETARALLEESLAIRRRLEDRAGSADSLEYLGWMVQRQGDLAGARALLGESLAIRRELSDQRGLASVLPVLALVALTQGDVPAARALLEESLAIRRELGDRRGILTVLCAMGELEAERSLLEEALATARELGDKELTARALTRLGCAADGEDEYAAARALLEESLAIWRELDYQDGVAQTLYYLGLTLRHQGDSTAAHAVFVEMLAITRKWSGGGKAVVWALVSLGLTAGDLGDWEQAAAHFNESLTLFGQGERSDKMAIPRCFHGLARLACAQGKPARAARLLGTAEALDAAIGPMTSAERREYDGIMLALRSQLDEVALAAARAAGQAMPVDGAIALALQEVSAG